MLELLIHLSSDAEVSSNKEEVFHCFHFFDSNVVDLVSLTIRVVCVAALHFLWKLVVCSSLNCKWARSHEYSTFALLSKHLD